MNCYKPVANCYGLLHNYFVVSSYLATPSLIGSYRQHYRSHSRTVLSHLNKPILQPYNSQISIVTKFPSNLLFSIVIQLIGTTLIMTKTFIPIKSRGPWPPICFHIFFDKGLLVLGVPFYTWGAFV